MEIIKIMKLDSKKRNVWSIEEDNLLKSAIDIYGVSDWNVVAKYVGKGRTRSQCMQRWKRDINPMIKREKWSVEEDKKLFYLVEKYGTKSWTRISNELQTRSDAQCRFRYMKLTKNSMINDYIKIEKVFNGLSDYIQNICYNYNIWDEI